MKKQPRLSFWQIWNMSFGFLGIQFGFALQNANVSRIFQTLGADISNLAILWVAAPATGLIVQPIIGYMSDKTWGRLGRRRPYFLIGAIFASIALFIMPNSPTWWMAAGMLWIMDASINVSMEPFRAFVGDMLPSEQRTRGFSMQVFFIGVGAVVASVLPYVLTTWFGVTNVAATGEMIPASVRWSFYLGGSVFFLAVLWTVISTKEYSPEELKSFSEERKNGNDAAGTFLVEERFLETKVFFRRGIIWTSIGLILSFSLGFFIDLYDLQKELYILTVGLVVFGLVQIISGLLSGAKRTNNGLVTVFTDLNLMPKTMKQLAVVQFFSWLALFSMWIYTTSAITSHIYGTVDTKSELYNEGANWAGVMFGVYNGFAAVMSFVLPVLARLTNRKITHIICLIGGGLGLASIYIFKEPNLLIISMLGVGMAWASILSMPYAILTGSLPMNKMGTYMGIFNFFIVIPQIVAASVLGLVLTKLFNGETVYVMVFGGISMIIAAISVLFVDDVDDPEKG